MNERIITLSKGMSWALRHDPVAAGIALDHAGWTGIAALLSSAAHHGHAMSRAELDEIVATSEKKRFAIGEDGSAIRANQGHSVAVDLGLEATMPPALLYHGTAERFLGAILVEGLRKQARHHVHLSADCGTATAVGIRHGRPVLGGVGGGEARWRGTDPCAVR